MISSNTPSTVNWTTSSAPVSPAVPAVMAVAPAAPASRDAQPGLEQRRGQARAVPERKPEVKTGADRKAEDAERAARSERLEAERERSVQREQAQRETMEQLRQTLRRVWDASGAVVEQALAREQEQAGTAAGRARPVDAYETPAEPADRPPHLSRRV